MAERTHLTQADEALQQATAPAPAPARRSSPSPTASPGSAPMARCTTRCAWRSPSASPPSATACTPAADQLEAEILARAPRIEDDITRGEYALVLHRAAEAVR